MMIPPGFISICAAYERFLEQDAHAARGRLAFLLFKEELQAFYFDHELHEHILPGTYWRDNDYIPHLFSNGELTYGDDERNFGTAHVVVRDCDLSAIFDGQDRQSNTAPVTSMDSPNKGGRPPKFDSDAIWSVIFELEYGGGLVGKNQEQMIAAARARYAECFGPDSEPSRATVQKVVRLVHAILNDADLAIVFPNANRNSEKEKLKSS